MSSNLSLAIIPFDTQESLHALPAILYIDSTGITRWSLMADALVQGEERSQGLENMSARSEGEQMFSSQDQENSSDDENITLLEMLSQIRTCSKRSSSFCKHLITILPGTPEESHSILPAKVPMRVTRSAQRTREAETLAKSTKKIRTRKRKSSSSLNFVAETVNSQKKKKISSKSKSQDSDDSDYSVRVLAFKKRSVIRGRVISGFGGGEMDELVTILQDQGWTELMLQGSFRRKMVRVETREFYINATAASSITSTVCGVSFTLTAETLSSILRIPNRGWGHYVKKDWPPLEGNTSQLDICRRFSNDPTLSEYSSVDKGCMLPLHQLLFNVVH